MRPRQRSFCHSAATLAVGFVAAFLMLAAPVEAGDVLVHVPSEAATIQEAIQVVDPGGRVVVAPGTYNELVDFQGKALTLQSEDPTDLDTVKATIITGAGLSGSVISCINGEGSDSILLGLTITGGTGTLLFGDLVGGGMLSVGSSPTVSACRFVDNQIGPVDGNVYGGGMFNSQASPTVSRCEFSGNSATAIDGVVMGAAGLGGGLGSFDGAPLIEDCLFVDNSGGNTSGGGFGGGGGVWIRNFAAPLSALVVNSTFVDNHLVGFSSGGAFNGSATVRNCVMSGNDGAQIAHVPAFPPDVAYSLVSGGWPGAGNIDVDPLFADAGAGDYRLASGSGCIDAGDNTAVPAGVLIDLEGRLRFVDDPDTADTGVPDGQNPPVDMGAYEFQGLCDGTTASVVAYGSGKPGTNGIPLLFGTPPGLGQAGSVTLVNGLAGATPGVLFVGAAAASVPFDGGTLLVDPLRIFTLPPLNGSGSVSYPFLLSADPSLCGLEVFVQGMFVDPGASGTYQTAQTPALILTIGE